jgi:glucokinase
VREGRLASREHATFEDAVRAFLGADPPRVRRVAVGVAGPIVGTRCEATNLPWVVDATALGAALGGAPVRLLNDLEATAWGIGTLAPADLEVLQAGDEQHGNRALIAAGTGLGQGLLVRDRDHWRPSPSEGGHVDLAPRDALEDELLAWLRARHGRVSYERVLSGPGLANLYRFLRDSGRGDEPAAFARVFDAADDPAAAVTAGALDGSCGRAVLALERFAELYGAQAGNLALTTLALGGVYVAGGIAPRILPFLRDGRFVRAFGAKGRLSPLLARIPVRVVLDHQAPLWGAAHVALEDA